MALNAINLDVAGHESEIVLAPATTNNKDAHDWLLRSRQTSTGHTVYTPILTESITRPVRHLIQVNNLFREVIKNLWGIYKYQQEYHSFLLGGLEEAEFLKIAERYAVSFQQMPVETLSWASSVLLNILDNYLTSSDLSALLNVDPSDIEHTLSSSPGIHTIPIEPEESYGH
jgi:hypothetical protein